MINRLTANAADLAADYKARGIDRQATYSHFVSDRALKPEIDAKEFFAIFDVVSPKRIIDEIITIQFHPTHWDVELEEYVQVSKDDNGVYHMLWATGHQGTNPPGFPMEKYKPLTPDGARP